MDIQDLRYFSTIAQLGNVSRAAELFHVSQSSLSKKVAALEAELGVSLFDRHGKKLVLNAAGTRFLESCTAILAETDQAVHDLQLLSSGADNIIRICASGMRPNLLSCMSEFRLYYSNVEYVIEDLNEDAGLPDINHYDMIVYPDERKYDKFKGVPLYREQYCLAVPSDNPLASRISVPIRMLDRQDIVFLKQENGQPEYPYHVCTALAVEMGTVSYVDTRMLHCQMIAAGIGVGFVPESCAELYRHTRGIRLLTLTEDRFTRPMMVCFKREKHLSELAGAFKKQILATITL